ASLWLRALMQSAEGNERGVFLVFAPGSADWFSQRGDLLNQPTRRLDQQLLFENWQRVQFTLLCRPHKRILKKRAFSLVHAKVNRKDLVCGPVRHRRSYENRTACHVVLAVALTIDRGFHFRPCNTVGRLYAALNESVRFGAFQFLARMVRLFGPGFFDKFNPPSLNDDQLIALFTKHDERGPA